MLPASEILFTVSKRRVFPNPDGPADAEASPKWLALTQVISEIHKGLLAGNNVRDLVEDKLEEMFETETAKKDPGTILVLTRDERCCSQLNTVSLIFLIFSCYIFL